MGISMEKLDKKNLDTSFVIFFTLKKCVKTAVPSENHPFCQFGPFLAVFDAYGSYEVLIVSN